MGDDNTHVLCAYGEVASVLSALHILFNSHSHNSPMQCNTVL